MRLIEPKEMGLPAIRGLAWAWAYRIPKQVSQPSYMPPYTFGQAHDHILEVVEKIAFSFREQVLDDVDWNKP